MQDDQANVFDLGLFKLTLLQLEVELVLAEALQDKASDLTVFLQHFGIDEDVIKVYTHYALCYEVLEDVIHHGLKGGGAIGKSEEHNEWFKQAPASLEGSLPLVSFLDAHIVVTPLDIQFSEVLCTPEVVDELEDEGEGVMVLHCYGVENLVVLDQSEQAILLLDEEDWRGHWRLRRADATRVQVLLQECIELLLLPGHKWVDLTAGECGIWQQFNGVVPPLVLWK
ncbi:hypothetical protein C0989_012551 [Termitomyces sp. Mn162]|nr:hypothetical protein C0989_012551 [Termitomyces sp. Mn162]